jgi:hypothetical protein
LNAGTVLAFFHFIIGYEKIPAELQLLNKDKNMVVIVIKKIYMFCINTDLVNSKNELKTAK